MFRIECMCDDRRLAAVLRALAGLVVADPQVHPVIEAKGEAAGNGATHKLMVVKAKAEGLTKFTGKQAKVLVKALGKNPGSTTHYLNMALRDKLLKKSGKGSGTTYTVAS